MAKLLGIPLEQTVKSIVLATEGDKGQVQIWLLMLRGDHELNEIKAGKLPGLAGFRFATESEIVEHFGCKPGYLGPVGTARRSASWPTARSPTWRISSAAPTRNTSTSGRELGPRPAQASRSPTCATWSPATPRQTARARFPSCAASRVGHVFYLGKKYSEALKATFLTRPASPPRWKWAATASA